VGSAKLLEAKQAISINDQYAVNRNALKYTIGIANVALNGVQDVMQSMNEQIVNLGNGSLNSSNRQSIALTLQSQLDHLVSLSNTKDAAGHYIFSGYKSDTASINASTYVYGGDANNRRTIGGFANNFTEDTLSGDVGELFVFPTALNTTNRQAVESYLRTKWGTP
jgi:flagellar hook-associated protein 3 FlgL